MNSVDEFVHSACQAMRRLAYLSMACTLAVLSACNDGGSGGGSGGEGGGGTPVTLSADVFPLAVGDRHFWREIAPANSGQMRSRRIIETVQIDGRSALVARDETGALSYFVRTTTGVSSVPGPGSSALEAALGAFEYFRVGQLAGETVVPIDRTVAVDLDGDGRTDSAELRYEITFVGYEDITTALGIFKAAAHVRSVTRATYRYAQRAAPQTVVTTTESWLAPGIGNVGSTTSTTVDRGAVQNTTEQLTAYNVGPLRSERVGPVLLSSYPEAGAFFPGVGPIALNYDEPLDELSLKNSIGPVLVAEPGGIVVPTTLRLSQKGFRLELLPLSPLPEGFYEVRTGSAITDLLNNPIADVTRRISVDVAAPTIVSSVPANNAQNVSLTSELALRFSEPVFYPPNITVALSLLGGSKPGSSTPELRVIPATVRGNEVVAVFSEPLQRNTEYVLSLALNGGVVDRAGNYPDRNQQIRFRTDSGLFLPPVELLPNSTVDASVLTDVDGDGRKDLLLFAHPKGPTPGAFQTEVFVRYQQTNGRFAELTKVLQLSDRFSFGSSGLIDVDGDGRPDLVLNNGSALYVALQKAPGIFVLELVTNTTNSLYVESFDLPGDTRRGMFTLRGREFTVFRRDSAGSWTSSSILDAGFRPIAAGTLVDLNGDGKADLVWLRFASNNIDVELAWALREGNGFGPARTFTPPGRGILSGNMAVGDVTGDGKPDVVVLLRDRFGNAQPGVLRQNAAGSFDEPAAYATVRDAQRLTLADVDGDGRLDVVVAHERALVVGVYLQLADGTLAAERGFDAISPTDSDYPTFGTVTVADLNADGRDDLIIDGNLFLSRPFAGPGPASTTQRTRTMSAVLRRLGL
jgi:Bacterial Ig-like domain/FG-GAP-like repeat